MKSLRARTTACLLIGSLLSSLAAQAQPLAAPAVPSPAAVALEELHQMQLREPELWRERDKYCVGCGAAALAVGIPVAVSMLTTGSMWFAFANDYYSSSDYYDDEYADEEKRWRRQDRGIGMGMILLGLGATALAVWGARKIIRERKPRNAALAELRSYADRRTLLEKILEAYLVQPQP